MITVLSIIIIIAVYVANSFFQREKMLLLKPIGNTYNKRKWASRIWHGATWVAVASAALILVEINNLYHLWQFGFLLAVIWWIVWDIYNNIYNLDIYWNYGGDGEGSTIEIVLHILGALLRFSPHKFHLFVKAFFLVLAIVLCVNQLNGQPHF